MAEEAEKKTEERGDADAGMKLDKLLSAIDGMCEKVDSLHGRMDSAEKRMDSMEHMRKDASEKEEEKREDKRKDAAEDVKEEKSEQVDSKKDAKRKDADEEEREEKEAEPEETAADRKRKDMKRKDEDGEEAEKEAAKKDSRERGDSVTISAKDLNDLRTRLRDLETAKPKPRTDADFHAITEQQARYDSVFQALGQGPAPLPMSGEDVTAYKLRCASKLKAYSPRWKDSNLYTVGADSAALEIADRQILEDAVEASRAPVDLEPGELREIVRQDATGRRITEFVGKGTFIGGMKAQGRRVERIRNSNNSTVH